MVSFAESTNGNVIVDYDVTINPWSNVDNTDLDNALVASLVDGTDIVGGSTFSLEPDSIVFDGWLLFVYEFKIKRARNCFLFMELKSKDCEIKRARLKQIFVKGWNV